MKIRRNIAHSVHSKVVIQRKKLIRSPYRASVRQELGLAVQLAKRNIFLRLESLIVTGQELRKP